MRYMHRFWTDISKPQHQAVAQYVEELKEKRSFTRTVINALLLIRDLSQGKTDVLHELFPWVLEEPKKTELPEHFYEGMETFWGKLESVEKLLLNPPIIETEALSVSQPKRLPAPTDDDLLGDLEIKQATSDENPTYNMLISGVGLGITEVKDLPPDCIEYGVKKGKLAESALNFIPKSIQPKGPKAMDVPQFAAPEIDLDDLALDF